MELQDRSRKSEVLAPEACLMTRIHGQKRRISSGMYVRKTMVQLAVCIGAAGGIAVVVAAVELVD